MFAERILLRRDHAGRVIPHLGGEIERIYHPHLPIVITSYSIHYTKLYESQRERGPDENAPRERQLRDIQRPHQGNAENVPVQDLDEHDDDHNRKGRGYQPA